MQNINLDIKDIITILVALYGAILSTVVFIRERRKDRRNIILFFEVNEILHPSMFVLRAVNTGFRPVTLVDAGLRIYYRGGIRWHYAGVVPALDKLPVTLTDSSPETWIFNYGDIRSRGLVSDPRQMVKVVGYVRDSEGQVYKNGKPEHRSHIFDELNAKAG